MNYGIGGLVLLAVQTASLLSTPARANTVVPSDWVIETQHCANSPSDTTIHSRGFALAYRQWRCVNSHVYTCDPIGTNADCSIAEYWTPIERDVDEVQQAEQRVQQTKDNYLRNAQSELAMRLMLTGTGYHGPEWRGKIRIHITSDGIIDHISVLEGIRNVAFFRQLQFQLSQVNFGAPPPGCDVMDAEVKP